MIRLAFTLLLIPWLAAGDVSAFGQPSCLKPLGTVGINPSLSDKIEALAKDGVPPEIIQSLLESLRRFPKKWELIGDELLEATRLTRLIEQKATRVHTDMVPIRLLSTTHEIAEPDDRAKLQKRINEVKKALPEILQAGEVDAALRQRLIPSASPVIRAAKDPAGRYYVFDGNSRTEALRAALGKPHADTKIEVVVYDITDPAVARKILDSQRQRKGHAFDDVE